MFSGFNSTDAWTDDKEAGFKEALLASLPLVDSVDDINITGVTLEKNERRTRHLNTVYLTVAYTLLVNPSLFLYVEKCV